MTTAYEEFLKSKVPAAKLCGFESQSVNPKLFEFQKAIAKWSIKKGRSANFCDTGLGKTPMQFEWVNQVAKHTGEPVLILAPLGVANQSVEQAEKFGYEVKLCQSHADVIQGVNITNYEKLHLFNTSLFSGVCLDESSILKSFMGKTKIALCEQFARTQFKLACTATPAPNDHMEIGNHAEFLGIMPANEMLSRWFINDTMHFGNYRLKRHAVKDFWEWVASWAICVSKPSDIGFPDDGYILPPLEIHHVTVDVDYLAGKQEGELFRVAQVNATTMHKEKRLTLKERCEKAREIAGDLSKKWCIWCGLNDEQDALEKLFGDKCVSIRGSTSDTGKIEKERQWRLGDVPVMITKESIFGYGMNWQHCANVIVVGVDFSNEALYQLLRRHWRFGQMQKVRAWIIAAETEHNIINSLNLKQKGHDEMRKNMKAAQKKLQMGADLELKTAFEHRVEKGSGWEAHLGDSCELIKLLPDNSVDFCIHSPPFSNLYIYSDSIRDMGNCATDAEFFKQYDFLIPELFRVIKPGRLCAVHCKNLVKYKNRDGQSGLKDFRGEIIRHFELAGWQYHSEVCIWKDPVIEMQRTKAHGLLYKQLRADASFSRQGMAEYLVVFRKWTEGEHKPVEHSFEDIPLSKELLTENKSEHAPMDWQNLASPHWSTDGEIHAPVWRKINQTEVLNKDMAKSPGDEKHICPLQLDVIERAIKLWTNPGEIVFSPFGGIGSEGYQALKMNRRAIIFELKESYFKNAVQYLASASAQEKDLFAAEPSKTKKKKSK